jgi:hypothetical protein
MDNDKIPWTDVTKRLRDDFNCQLRQKLDLLAFVASVYFGTVGF